MQLLLITAASLTPLAQDTIVVRADGRPVWGAAPRVVEEVRIGMVEGPPEYTFGGVSAIAAGLDGSIIVYDWQVNQIRRYDEQGEFVKDIGRDGEGPGEYRQVMGLETLRDGRIVSWDPRLGRITIYSPQGVYETSLRTTGGTFAADVFQADTAGNFYIKGTDPTWRPPPPPSGERGRPVILTTEPPRIVTRVASTGEESVIRVPPADADGAGYVLATAEGYRGNFRIETLHAMSSHGYLITARNDSYALDLRLPNGTIRRIVRQWSPARIGRGERDQWTAWSAHFARRSGEDYPDVPATKPAFRRLFVDDDGRIWVDRYVEATKHDAPPREPGDSRPPYQWREPATYDVLGADGTFFGTVLLPKDASPWVVRGMEIWGTVRGEFDVTYVVRWRIHAERGGI